MYTRPEALHILLNKITQSIEEILTYQSKLVKNWLGFGHDCPITKGVRLSDDAAAYLSPQTYTDFINPYNDKLSLAFGGITLNYCLKYKQNLSIMVQTKGFIGFDP